MQAVERLKSLGNLLGFRNRIISNIKNAEVRLLKTPLKINIQILKKMKIKSMNFIRKNLNIK